MPSESRVSVRCTRACADNHHSTRNGIVYDALAADYDGDSKLDLFVLYKTSVDQQVYRGGILWGDRVKLSEPFLYPFQ
jgi:hypothetical protein